MLRYCDHHHFFLPDGHKFPLTKYRLLRERLQGDSRFRLEPSELVSRAAVLRVHEPNYANGFLTGTLEPQVMRRIGFPWSPELVTRTLASAGGTLLAARTALQTGFGGTLAGGTHHAFRDAGSGFCIFNDLAIAIGWARAEAGIERAAVVDLDVHQGDGTAAIFGGNPGVFTLSVHGARNFPFRKQTSTLDLELPDYTDDKTYLAALQPALQRVWDFAPQLLLFQAGVDLLSSDRLGRLALTLPGLLERDSLVIGEAYRRGIPLVITIGGGYSDPIEQTVVAHAQTFQTAAAIYFGDPTEPPCSFHPKSMPEL
ncbi:MAG: histone deacetylase [Acidobacteriaceae bacterium]|nr:histone deacetylase [Acidobacteriaceae bacterium]